VSTTVSRQVHLDQLLIEVTSLLVDRARIQLERDVAAADDPTAPGDLQRLREMEHKLRAIRKDFGLTDAPPSAPERQVSRFYEVPGQEDA
jgi:hypothetical protein